MFIITFCFLDTLLNIISITIAISEAVLYYYLDSVFLEKLCIK